MPTAFGQQVPLPVYCDDEGTPAEDAILIKQGILTGYMNNRESAQFGMSPRAMHGLFSRMNPDQNAQYAILPVKTKTVGTV